MAEMLSNTVLGLDRASGHLDRLNQALLQGESASADGSLRDYVRELTSLRMELKSLLVTQDDLGLIGAVLDRLDSQLARLEKMKGHVVAGHSASVEEPLDQVKAMFQLIQKKVIDRIT
jgi:ethanolamine utilization microcompartment shell protein EutS